MRSEILPLASVGCLSLAIVGLFPPEVLTYGRTARAVRADETPAAAGCAFVTLTPQQAREALAAARTSWQGKAVSAGLRAEMLPAELPELPHAPVLELSARQTEAIGFTAKPQVRTLPPSVAAPAPRRLKATEPETPKLAFPKEKLLELGGPTSVSAEIPVAADGTEPVPPCNVLT